MAVGNFFRLGRIAPEAERDEQQKAGAEQETAFPFQARFGRPSG